MSVATNAKTKHYQAMTTAPEVVGNIEAIDQCRQLVEQVLDIDYSRSLQPYVQSSIGEHLRHVLDVYNVLMLSAENGLIDYNYKRRGSDIETSRAKALSEIEKIRAWLHSLDANTLARVYTVRSELTLHGRNIGDMESTLRRELVFASSHVIHHSALIGVCARLCNLPTDELFGVAPATASYWRENGKLSAEQSN